MISPIMECFKKSGKEWEQTYMSCEPEHVYEMLASHLSYHFIHKSDYAKRFKREQLYTHQTFTFYDAEGQYKIMFTVDSDF